MNKKEGNETEWGLFLSMKRESEGRTWEMNADDRKGLERFHSYILTSGYVSRQCSVIPSIQFSTHLVSFYSIRERWPAQR